MFLHNNNKYNLYYFMHLGLHLGKRVEDRKNWISNFILGSRSFWDVLNIIELLKIIEILGPIIIYIVKKGGTILIISKKMSKESRLLGKLFSVAPYKNIINIYLDRWVEGAFTNFFNFKFLNLRQLPNILFLIDFTSSSNMLDEAYYLRIPVVALVDAQQHLDTIVKKITIPIPANNSVKSLFFFFNFFRYCILKGLYFFDYSVIKDIIFYSFLKNMQNLKYSLKNLNFLKLFSLVTIKKKNFFFYYLKNYLRVKDSTNIEGSKFFINIKKKPFIKDKTLMDYTTTALLSRGFIQRYRGVIKTFFDKFNEILSAEDTMNNNKKLTYWQWKIKKISIGSKLKDYLKFKKFYTFVNRNKYKSLTFKNRSKKLMKWIKWMTWQRELARVMKSTRPQKSEKFKYFILWTGQLGPNQKEYIFVPSYELPKIEDMTHFWETYRKIFLKLTSQKIFTVKTKKDWSNIKKLNPLDKKKTENLFKNIQNENKDNNNTLKEFKLLKKNKKLFKDVIPDLNDSFEKNLINQNKLEYQKQKNFSKISKTSPKLYKKNN